MSHFFLYCSIQSHWLLMNNNFKSLWEYTSHYLSDTKSFNLKMIGLQRYYLNIKV